jgi:hypothetical protein
MRKAFLLACLFTSAKLHAADVAQHHSVFRDIVIPAGEIASSAECYFCSIRVEGTLQDSAVTILGDIEISGSTADAVAVGGDIHLGSSAQATGDCVAVSGDVVRGQNSSVGGDVSAVFGDITTGAGAAVTGDQSAMPIPFAKWMPGKWRATFLLWSSALLVSLILATIAYLGFRQQRLEIIYGAIRSRPVLTVLTGIGILVVVTLILSLTDGTAYEDAATRITLISLLLLLAPGFTAMSLKVGQRCTGRQLPAILLGTILMVSAACVPVLGWILFAIWMVLAGGSLFAGRFGTIKAASQQPSLRKI